MDGKNISDLPFVGHIIAEIKIPLKIMEVTKGLRSALSRLITVKRTWWENVIKIADNAVFFTQCTLQLLYTAVTDSFFLLFCRSLKMLTDFIMTTCSIMQRHFYDLSSVTLHKHLSCVADSEKNVFGHFCNNL